MAITRLLSPPPAPRILTWDLEWLPNKLEITIAGLYDGRHYRAFKNLRSFIDHVLSRRYRGAYFFAHYGGRFDAVFLVQAIRLIYPRIRVSAIFKGASAVLIELSDGRGVWRFADSQFLFKAPLADIGNSVGIVKPDCPFDAPWPQLRDRNEADCQILYAALDRAAHALAELGSTLSFTLASTALRLFRVRYLSEDIPTSGVHNEEIRPGYVASRVENFRERALHGYLYDVNSSFPYSQMVAPLPGRHLKTNREIGELSIVKARVSVPPMWLPPLPARVGGSIYFPTGEWEGWYCREDLELLEEFGGKVLRVDVAHHYEPWDDIGGFVRDIYRLRLRDAGDPFRKEFWKIMMNAGVYGKLGERGEREKILFAPERLACPHPGAPHESIPGRPSCMRRVGPAIWAVKEDDHLPHTHLPVPIVTTARSRALLARYARQAEELAYVDTDCVASKTRFESSSDIGRLKFECEYRDARFVRPKLYTYEKTEITERDVEKAAALLKKRGIAGDPLKEAAYVVKAKGFPRMLREEFDYLTGTEPALPPGRLEIRQFDGLRKTMMRVGLEPREGVILKGLYRECAVCESAVSEDLCADHPDAHVILGHQKRPKRCATPDGSRPWAVEELFEKPYRGSRGNQG